METIKSVRETSKPSLFGKSILELDPFLLVFFGISTTRYYHIISIKQLSLVHKKKVFFKDFKILMSWSVMWGVHSCMCTIQCTQLSSQHVSLADHLSLLQDVTVPTQKATNRIFFVNYHFVFFLKKIRERNGIEVQMPSTTTSFLFPLHSLFSF